MQMRSGGSLPGTEMAAPAVQDSLPVKLEIFQEDALEEEYGPLSKRAKASSGLEQQQGAGANAFTIPPSRYNPLDEPSPLGLRLKKSPSLLDLIEMRLSQASHVLEVDKGDGQGKGVKKDNQSSAACSVSAYKMKASNFPGSVLKIGEWKYESRYEGDLVAKCYFAKRKLVWEILEGGLKSKIEIQWSDIVALKAVSPDNGSGELNVVLGKQPLFFRETNPQPRKHTLWQATSDFTDGHASTHRQHRLECPSELLKKNFEKLIQCDVRLYNLSQQGEIVVDTPLFEAKPPLLGDSGQSKSFCKTANNKGSSIHSVKSDVAKASSLGMELSDCASAAPELRVEETTPSSSDAQASEVNESSEATDTMNVSTQEQVKLPGLCKSMSVSDLVNHIGQCIAENMDAGIFSPDHGSQGREALEDIAKYLLSDTQMTTRIDEKSLMSRANSLCCLLQVDPQATIQGLQKDVEAETSEEDAEEEGTDGGGKEAVPSETTYSSGDSRSVVTEAKVPEGDQKDVSSSCKQHVGMSRKDSFGDLLLHLPRIASLPKFLFDISEEGS